jgi:hypothetical protein
MAVDFGQASVQGSSMAAAKSSPDFVMNVLPAGTCILSERVTQGAICPSPTFVSRRSAVR